MLSINELRKQIIFGDIKDADLGKLLGSIEERSLRKGEFLFREGEDTKGI
ncbi:MAG: hypothetical protein DDT19_02820 [Syntrophomonadaceae bacterium]|nr:hypothetical protein [Bacillota bacterium]